MREPQPFSEQIKKLNESLLPEPLEIGDVGKVRRREAIYQFVLTQDQFDRKLGELIEAAEPLTSVKSRNVWFHKKPGSTNSATRKFAGGK